MDRLHEREDASTEARPRDTCRHRTARLRSRRKRRFPQKLCRARCLLGSRQSGHVGILSSDTCKHHARDTWWSSNGWSVNCLAIVVVLRCSPISRRQVQICKVHADPDLAGDLGSRRSTTGRTIRRGRAGCRQRCACSVIHQRHGRRCSGKDSEGNLRHAQTRHLCFQGHVTMDVWRCVALLELTIQKFCSPRRAPQDNCDVGVNIWDNDVWLIPAEQSWNVGTTTGSANLE